MVGRDLWRSQSQARHSHWPGPALLGAEVSPKMETPASVGLFQCLAPQGQGVLGKGCKVDDGGMRRGRREEVDVSTLLLSLWHRKTCLKQSAWNS